MTAPERFAGGGTEGSIARETVFSWSAVPLRMGAGAVQTIGAEARRLGLRNVLLLTDSIVAETGAPAQVADRLVQAGLRYSTFSQVRSEPTDASIDEVVEAVGRWRWDGIVALGGGSVIDTAKAVNLLVCCGGTLRDYLNRPIGEGREPASALRPLIAVPTTAGTGSESTPVCILDVVSLELKTGISHPRLRPSLAIVDPCLTLTLPAEVTASCGMDIVCHALESYTARPYDGFEAHEPTLRPAYCGANPISDLWAERALRLCGRSLRRAVRDGRDLEARTEVMTAATFAGLGFGNAGVHLPHACSYPIAGLVRDYHPAGYPAESPMVPHGQAVSVTAPAAFRHFYDVGPNRQQHAARLLSDGRLPDVRTPKDLLASVLIALMRDIGIPSGIGALGFGEADLDRLVDGALRQERLLALAPRPVRSEEAEQVFRDSVENW